MAAWTPETENLPVSIEEFTRLLEKKYPGISRNPLLGAALNEQFRSDLNQVDPTRFRANARLKGYAAPLSDAQHTKVVKQVAGVRTYHKRKNGSPYAQAKAINAIRVRIARNSAYDADVAGQWRVATTNTYQSKDLPVLAAREALQNSVDAIRQAVKKKQIAAGAGRFEIVIEEANKTIRFIDNGTGMNQDVIKTFLTLSASGPEKRADKDPGITLTIRRYRRSDDRGAYYFRLNGLFQFHHDMFNTNSMAKMPYDYVFDYETGGTAGGFGLAKAVILGCSESKPPQWNLRTQNLYYDSEMAENDERGKPTPQILPERIQGTILEIRNIGMIENVWTEYTDWEGEKRRMVENSLPIRQRLKLMLQYSDCPDIELLLNGEKIEPYFSGKRGTKITQDNETISFPKGLMGSSGLAGTSGYPFNVGRDRLNSRQENKALQAFAAQAEQEPTVKTDKDDIIFDPSYSAGSVSTESETKYQEEFASALGSEDVKEALAQAVEISASYLRAENEKLKQARVAERRAAERADQTEGKSHAPPVETPNLKPSAGLKLTNDLVDLEKEEDKSSSHPEIDRFRKVFEDYNKMAYEGGYWTVNMSVIDNAIEEVRYIGSLSYRAIQQIDDQLRVIEGQAVGPGGGGLAQITVIRGLVDKFISDYAHPYDIKQARQGRNPLGSMGGLYISRKQFLDKDGRYNSAKASEFRKNAGKYIPYLLMWDQILRLVAQLNDVQNKFYSGFSLNDSLIAVYYPLPSGTKMIAINPFWFKLAKKGYDNAQDLALFLHGIACHELSHMLRGKVHKDDYGDGHDEQFSSIRESVASKSFPAIPAITALVVQFLGVPDRTSRGKRSAADKERIAELEAQLAAGCPGCLKELVTKLEESNRLDTVKWLNAKAGGGE